MAELASPIIGWYAKENSAPKFSAGSSLYAGTRTPDKELRINIQLWNNRWGTEDVKDLERFSLIMYFFDKEDSALLEYCDVEYNEEVLEKEIENGKALIKFPSLPVISGKANDGNSQSDDNADNFLAFDIIFTTGGERLKEEDLKSLMIEIVEI